MPKTKTWPYWAKDKNIFFETEQHSKIKCHTPEVAIIVAKYMSDAYCEGWRHANEVKKTKTCVSYY